VFWPKFRRAAAGESPAFRRISGIRERNYFSSTISRPGCVAIVAVGAAGYSRRTAAGSAGARGIPIAMTVVQDGLPVPQRYWAIMTMLCGVSMTVVGSSIANVALPSIARDFHTSQAAAIWVPNAFQLAISVTLLPFASLGEVVGYRRVYWVGLVVFAVSSLGCALSDSLTTLIIGRVGQGIGASAAMAVSSALMRFIYPRRMLGRGMGLNVLTVGVSSVIGPSLASAILAVASWQWLFLINVPIAIVALLGAPALPLTGRSGYGFDIVSALLNALAVGLLIIGVDGIARGDGGLVVAALLLGAGAVGYALVRRERDKAAPLLPLDLLRIPLFALSAATSLCSYMALMVAFVTLPFYLQDTLGRSQVETGLLMTPWPLVMGLISPLGGRLADRYPAGTLCGIGLLILAAGLLLLAIMPAQPTTLDIVWRMLVCGTGFGLFQVPNNRALMTAAPAHRAGGAGGMLATARNLGMTLGAALAALPLALFPGHGTSAALLIGVGFALAAAAVSFVRLIDLGAPAGAEQRASE
jgi:DHA2 family multidrug resistance protein-like MFS transporter